MKDNKIELTYKERLSYIVRNRKFWDFWEVRERLILKKVKKGYSKEHIRTVVLKDGTKNINIIESAEEVIRIRKQILEIKPMALESKASIILEYQKAVGLVKINGKITPSDGAAIKDPISLRTKEGIIEKYNSKLNALKATHLE
jgi:hypothetical protein